MTRYVVPLRAPAQRIFAVLLAAALAACGEPRGQPHGQMPPPEVAVVEVGAKRLPVGYEYAAQTAGYREVEVRARVTGILLKRNFAGGRAVEPASRCSSIDPAPFRPRSPAPRPTSRPPRRASRRRAATPRA